MKRESGLIKALLVTLLLFAAIFVLAGCQEERKVDTSGNADAVPQEDAAQEDSNTIAVTVGNTTYTAELEDNETVNEFKQLLPLTADMTELNGNEKYFDLPETLPEAADYSGEIHAGDIMLYGTDTLVLFYKDFDTTYSYTRIGRIVDPTGLESVLGSGNVEVKFE